MSDLFASKKWFTLLLLASLLGFCDLCSAQTVSGVISGSVEDSSGLAVVGAAVTLTNNLTGERRAQESGPDGSFIFAAVLPGRYTVAVEMKGFKRVEKQDLNITASERLPAGRFVLQVGSVTESVTVVASGTPVQTTSDERSAVLTPSQISTLMSRGRDFLSLLRVMPGVVPPNDSDAIGSRTAFANIQGTRISYSTVAIDGITTNDLGSEQTTQGPMNMDAIGEVKVLMTNYQAEYGRSAGAIINAVTKSGTKDFHGNAYYYKRHEQFNANDFFNNRNGIAKPRYRYNTYGYNVGGPVYFPNLLQRKDKLFFFFSQEILPTNTPQNLVQVIVPTAAQRAGDFSAQLPSIVIRNPQTGAPFPQNMVPPGSIDTNGQKLLSAFPLPNALDTTVTRGAYNYVFQETIPARRTNEVYRADYNITNKLRAYVRGSNFRLRQTGYLIPGAGSGAPWGELAAVNHFLDDSGVVNLTYTLNSTTINETSFSVHHAVQDISAQDQAAIDKISRTALGMTLPQSYPQLNPYHLIPWATFGIPGAASFTWDSRFPTKSADTVFDLTNNITKFWGPHNLKAGVYLERVRYFGGARGTNSGSFDFSSDSNNPLNTNYAYSNALIGVFKSYTESTSRVETNGRGTTLDWFLQDNWRATRKLTLDYGMRFTYYTPYSEKHNQDASFLPNLYNPAQAPRLYFPAINPANGQRNAFDAVTGTYAPALLIGAFVPNTGNTANGMVSEGSPGVPSGLMNHQGVLYAPRVGFAYDPFGDGKTAIRGGFGIFYNARERVLLLDVATTPPIQYNPTIYYGSLKTFLQSTGTVFPGSTAGLSLTGNVPSVYNFSFGIQRNIGFNTVLDVAYVGALGRHLFDSRNINTLPYGTRFRPSSLDPTTARPLPDQFLVPYSGYTNITVDEFATTSSYNAMQVQLNRRFSRGLQFGASWTWSKSMDYNSNDFAPVAQILPTRIWNYGKSDFDRTHIVQVNWLWDAPKATKLVKNRVVGAIADNWQISGIASFVSGAPLGISLSTTTGADVVGGGELSFGSPILRPNATSNPILAKGDRTFSRYFNTSAFALPTLGTPGNAPRDVVRGPGINNFDLSIFKNFPIKERARFQLRFEAYNAFNHTQFSSVNTAALFNPTTGQQVNAAFGSLTAARTARVGQASLRFTF